MSEELLVSPNFKNALQFFNTLEKINKPHQEPNSPIRSRSDASEIAAVQKLIPRAKLAPKFNTSCSASRKPAVPPRTKIPQKSTQDDLVQKIRRSLEVEYNALLDPLLNKDANLTPDIEAKKIVKDFKKKISPYNTFEIPFDALDSDFFKQTLELVPDVVKNVPESRKVKPSVYRIPAKKRRDPDGSCR